MPDEEDQIEEWFEKEKERVEEKYLKILNKSQDFKKVKNDMDGEMKALINSYEKRYDDLWGSQERKERLMKPVNYLKKKKKSYHKKAKKGFDDVKLWSKETYAYMKKRYGEMKSQIDLKIHRFRQKFRKKL